MPENAATRSTCPVACALDLLGDRWTLLVLRDLLLAGCSRFNEFAAREGIATNVLAERLDRLERAEVITKERDAKDGRRWVYAATERGADLIPVLLELGLWGAEHTPHAIADRTLLRRTQNNRSALIAELRARLLREG
jgi:DNA-binding HxlR family transcriptional regulator